MVAATLLVQADLSGTAYAGTFNPTDITRFVRLVDGISIANWRQDVLSDIAPSTMTLTLDNEALPDDATAPNAGRFSPGLSTSPWTGKILPGVRVRVTETVGGTAFPLFDGYVLDWTALPGNTDDGSFPVVQISCVDILGWMSTMQPLRSILLEELLLDAPTALYPLTEDAGSTSFGDLVGQHPAATLISSKYGASAITAGTAIANAVIGTGVAFANSTPTGPQTVIALPAAAVPRTASFSFEAWIVTTASPGVAQTIVEAVNPNSTRRIGITTSGTAVAVVPAAGAGISTAVTANDGQPHHVVGTYDGATLSIYFDGVLGSSAARSASDFVPSAGYIGGSLNYGNTLEYGFTGTVSGVAIYSTALSAARVLAHYNAGKTAFAGESTSTHVVRLLSYRPNVGSILGTGRGKIGVHETNGVTLQQALLDTAKAEGGAVFANGSGQVVFFSRGRLYNPAMSATFDVEADLTADFQERIDTQQLINDMTVTQAGGSTGRAVNATSIGTYGPRQKSDTYIVNSARDAVDAAGWIVANQKDAVVRPPALTADIVTMTSTSQAQAVLFRVPFDRVGLSNLPAWVPPTDVIIEGRTIHITDKEFAVGFFTSDLSRTILRADGAPSANTKLDNGLVIAW